MAEPRYFAYPSTDGLALFGRVWGEREAPPVVLLPGLTRNSRDFDALAQALSQHHERPRQVVAFDFRGRGGSAYGPVASYNPFQEAQDTLLGLAELGISRAVLLGTSRGGLVMLMLASLLKRADLFAGAIFNDIGPVIEAAGLTRIAGYVGKPIPEDWPGLVAELKGAQGALFPALSDEAWERYARQIYRDDGGRPRLAYDAALEEAFRAFDPAKPAPDLWPAFDALAEVPMMVIHGALSDILSGETVAQMAARHPGLAVYSVADQGHAPLLWDAASHAAIQAFLDGIA